MEFSKQESWSGLPFPSLGDLPNPEIKPGSPAMEADSLPTEPLGKGYTLSRPYFQWDNFAYANLFSISLSTVFNLMPDTE